MCTAAVLSACDAIDNVIFQPDPPIPTSNWAWYLLFDLPMPVWALLAIRAREDRDRALGRLVGAVANSGVMQLQPFAGMHRWLA